MTTIAVKDGKIAADTLETWASEAGGTTRHKCTKLYSKKIVEDDKPINVIIGTAGASFTALLFVDWYGSDKDPPEFMYHLGPEEDFDAIIMRPDGVFLANRLCRPVKLEGEFFAVGSGRKAALAAMMHGASAEQAVRTAIELDPYTGMQVIVKELEVT